MPTALDNGSRRARRLLPGFVRRLFRQDSEEDERELRRSAERRSQERRMGHDPGGTNEGDPGDAFGGGGGDVGAGDPGGL